jgi:hypothetical protein
LAGDSTMTSDVDIGGQLKGTGERLSNTPAEARQTSCAGTRLGGPASY